MYTCVMRPSVGVIGWWCCAWGRTMRPAWQSGRWGQCQRQHQRWRSEGHRWSLWTPPGQEREYIILHDTDVTWPVITMNVTAVEYKRPSRTYLVLCVSQNSLHGSVGGSLDHPLDVFVCGLEIKGRGLVSIHQSEAPEFESLLSWKLNVKKNAESGKCSEHSLVCRVGVTHWLFQTDSQVNHWHVGGGDTEGHASQLAVENKDRSGQRKMKNKAIWTLGNAKAYSTIASL